jgi:FkbM family methyltransferase
LQSLKAQSHAFFDLAFVKAMPPEKQSECLSMLSASSSQLRQDLFAFVMLDFKKDGFFVEFGATDGVSLSNSYVMETGFGWSGILAEPARDWHDDLKANRKATIETRCVWRKSAEKISFTEAPRGEHSSVTSYVSNSRRRRGKSYDVETISLNDLLTQHNAPHVIDYLSVDTEGSEYEIMKTVDFDEHQFNVMTIEHNDAPERTEMQALLVVASTGERNTLIFWKRWSVGNEVSYQDLLFG